MEFAPFAFWSSTPPNAATLVIPTLPGSSRPPFSSSPFCFGIHTVTGDFASAEARRWLSDRPRHPFGFPLISLYRTKRWRVAAALSAAVTTTKQQETAPTSQAVPSQKKRPNSNASRSSGERGLGGEGLLSEKPPLPPESPVTPVSSGREREGGELLFREASLPRNSPRKQTPH